MFEDLEKRVNAAAEMIGDALDDLIISKIEEGIDYGDIDPELRAIRERLRAVAKKLAEIRKAQA